MLDAMKWLVRSARPHDSLFFHCTFFFPYSCRHHLTITDSGHGGQVEDQDGDEIDGFDEGLLAVSLLRDSPLMLILVIFPLDFKENGHISDDVSTTHLSDSLFLR